MDSLIITLKHVRRRLLLVRSMEAGLAGGLAAGVLGLALAAVRILLPRALPASLVHPAWPLAFVPAGFALAFLVRLATGVSLRRAAIAADRAGLLKERLATALEILEERTDEDRPGLLDDRLLEQARAEARRLVPARLPLATCAGSRGRALLLVVLALVLCLFIPSVGGPLLEPKATAQAARPLDQARQDDSIAPALRAQVDEAIARLRQPGARQTDADQATGALYRAATEAGRKRAATARALERAEIPEVQTMVRAARSGNGAGAAAAARELADRLSRGPGAGGLPRAGRERLADTLEGAAAEAVGAGLVPLAKELKRAAETVREPAAPADEALERLAWVLTEALGEESAAGIALVLDAVRQARRTLGLAEPPLPVEGVAAVGSGSPESASSPPEPKAERPADTSESPPAAPGLPVPPDVRPEDRDVVRRYFGG